MFGSGLYRIKEQMTKEIIRASQAYLNVKLDSLEKQLIEMVQKGVSQENRDPLLTEVYRIQSILAFQRFGDLSFRQFED